MSLTPMDERQGDRPVADQAEQTSATLRERVGASLRAFLSDLPFGERFVEWRDRRRRDDPEPQVQAEGLADDATDPPDCPTIEGLPDRQRPFTYPARNHTDRNPVDLVAIETDEGLTISLPENPDATITSDEWEQVEP